MSTPLLVLISCENHAQAEQLGEHLLKKKLAACVQIVERVNSMYLWPPGKNLIDYADESILLVKTLKTKWSALEQAVISHHSYENPEVIAIPLSHVTKKYLAWMKKELS